MMHQIARRAQRDQFTRLHLEYIHGNYTLSQLAKKHNTTEEKLRRIIAAGGAMNRRAA